MSEYLFGEIYVCNANSNFCIPIGDKRCVVFETTGFDSESLRKYLVYFFFL